jgi:hypothetical protein
LAWGALEDGHQQQQQGGAWGRTSAA